jgi:hypothetical protein
VCHSLGSHREPVLSDTALHRPPPLFQARPEHWAMVRGLRSAKDSACHCVANGPSVRVPAPARGPGVAEEPCQCSSFGLSHGDSGPGEPHDAGSMARRGIGNVAAGSLVICPGPQGRGGPARRAGAGSGSLGSGSASSSSPGLAFGAVPQKTARTASCAPNGLTPGPACQQ